MERLDRRELLRRGGAAALALGLAPALAAGSAAAAGGDRRLRELGRSLQGDLVTRASAGYRSGKRLYDTRFDAIRPLAIAYCESAEDVQKAVRWCRKYAIRPAARSGGHSYGGYSSVGDGLVIDVGRLDHVAVGPGGTATIGAGATLGTVDSSLWNHGVAVPGGSCTTVGIAGLALGGGHGFSSRKLGLTCDNVEGLTLVTAAGALLTCSATQNPDLFWACRGGGGGNFGVVTEFAFRTHPVSNVATYSFVWPWARAGDVVAAWQAFAPDAPDELFSVCHLRATPSGGPVVSSAGQFFGSEADLRSLLQPLLAVGQPTSTRITTRTFINAVGYWSGGSAPHATFAAKSDYLRAPLTRPAIGVLVDAVAASQANARLRQGSVLMDSYGGAINRVPAGATAFVHRNDRVSVQYVSSWNPGARPPVVAANVAWLRGLYAAMRPHVSGFAYQNYIDPDLATWKHAYYGSNYKRLVQVKRAVDPGNLFRFHQSIPPH